MVKKRQKGQNLASQPANDERFKLGGIYYQLEIFNRSTQYNQF